MKKGFTMIELIFVIVILGILASVAIPKLNATRDDAEEVKLKTNISTVITDFASYYTSKGAFGTTANSQFTPADLTEVTNVPLTISGANNNVGTMKVKGVDCIEFEIQSASAIKITPKGDAAGGVCKKVLDKSDVQAMLIGKAAWTADNGVNGNVVKDGKTVRYMDFGASGVTW